MEKKNINKSGNIVNNETSKYNVNIFTSGNKLTPKNLIGAKSETKKANHKSLADFGQSLEGELLKLVKSTDKKSRDTANALKSKFKTAANIVAACYPYQTKDGILCLKKWSDNTHTAKIWAEKGLTATTARGIIKLCTDNYINCLYTDKPLVTIVKIGESVE